MIRKILTAAIILAMLAFSVPAAGYAAEGNWSVDYDVVYTKATGSYSLKNVQADLKGGKAGSLTVTYPDSLTAEYKTPDGWTKATKSGSETAKGVERTVAFSIAAGASAAQVQAYLQSISFKPDKVNSAKSIRVTVEKSTEVSVPYDHPDGTVHYYRFINTGTKAESWTMAYNDARGTSYMGLKGYLATITSADEQSYIWNSIAEEPGWLGGTRFLTAAGNKINDENSIKEPTGYSEETGKTQDYYWTCGPEAGTVFFRTGAGIKTTNEIDGRTVYNDFDDNQPDGKGDGDEGFLEFAFNNQYWNDLPHAEYFGTYIKGYYIEYGGYKNEASKTSGPDYASAKDVSLAYAYELAHISDAVYDYAGGSVSREKLAELTNVQLKGISGESIALKADPDELEKLNTAVYDRTKGACSVRYTTEAGETFTVKVTLTGDKLAAKASTIKAGSSTMTKEDIINRAGVIITDSSGHPLDPSVIKVNSDQLSELNKAIKNRKPGNYKVTLYGADGTPFAVTVTVPKTAAAGGSSSGNSGSSGGGTGSSTATGDASNMASALAMMAAAGAVLAEMLIRRKKTADQQ